MKLDLASEYLKNGEVVVMPTDTVYGLVALAGSATGVERIFKLKNRDPDKPPTIIVGDINQLKQLSVDYQPYKKHLDKYWPGAVSLVMKCDDKHLNYLHRGLFSLAIRLPKHKQLMKLAKQVGPLATSSANPEGKPPAQNIAQAKAYFGETVSLYVDGGRLDGTPSTIVNLATERPTIIRA